MTSQGEQICEPTPGTIVWHIGWNFEHDPNYPCNVYIIDGNYLSNGRLSNFWKWRRVLPDNTLGEIEQGYGCFEESSVKYEIEITIKKKK